MMGTEAERAAAGVAKEPGVWSNARAPSLPSRARVPAGERARAARATRGRTRRLTPYRAALLVAILLYTATLGTMSALKHATYHSSLIDLGIFDQVIWNTAHGRLFWDTLDPYVQRYHVFLGQHFSPGLALLVPLYWIAPTVYSLLAAQAVALALGAVPIYLLAARRLADERIALLLAIAYLVSPLLDYVNLFDFHEIAMAVPFLAWAVERMDARRTRTALLMLLIAVLFKEEVGLIVAAFGLWVALAQRRRALGTFLLLFGLGWTATIVFWAIPHIRGGPYLFDARYQGGLLQHGRINLLYLTHFLSAQKLAYFGWLLGPLLALPLLAGWAALLLAPTTAYTLLSTYPAQYDIHYHYAAPLLPLLFCTTVYGLLRLPARFRLPAAGAVLTLVMLSGWLVGPLPGERGFAPSTYRMGPRARALASLVAMVPPGVSLAVDNQMGAHLTERAWVTHFFTGYERAQALLFDLRERSATEAKRLRAVAAIEHDPHWHLVARAQDYVLYLHVPVR